MRTESSRPSLPLERAITKLPRSLDHDPSAGKEGDESLARYEVSRTWRGLKLLPPLPEGATLTRSQASARQAGLDSLNGKINRTIVELKVNVDGTALLKAIRGSGNLQYGHLKVCLQWLKYAQSLRGSNPNLRQAEKRAQAVGELVRYLAARGEQPNNLDTQSVRVEAALHMLQCAMPYTAEDAWRAAAPRPDAQDPLHAEPKAQAAEPQAVKTEPTTPDSTPSAPLRPDDDRKMQWRAAVGPTIAFGPTHDVPQSSQAAQQVERSQLIATTAKTLRGERPDVVLRADVAVELATLVVDGALAGRGTLADLTRHADAVVMEHYSRKRGAQLYKPSEDPTITVIKKPFRDFYEQRQAQLDARKHAESGSAPAVRVRMIQSSSSSSKS